MTTYDARDLNLTVDKDALKSLFKIKPHIHALALVVNWIIIAAAAYISVQAAHPLIYVLAVIVIGARVHALAILMHDATHYRFLKNRRWNDILTNLTTMYPLFTSIEQYRQNHLRHHQHLNTEDDPDWVAKLGKVEFTFPKTRREFLITVFSYLTLYRGIKDAIWFLQRFQAPAAKRSAAQENKPLKLGFYLVLFTSLTVLGMWKIFLLYWVIPYLSTFFMFQYIRSVAEHYGELAYENLLNSTRTVRPSLLERFFLAPHHVGYHLEHHLYPGVPFYHLPRLHQLLMTDTEYHSQAHITRGYVKGLLQELG